MSVLMAETPVIRLSANSGEMIIPVDGLTLYLSRACDKLYSRAIVLLCYNISPLCDVAQTSDCGMYCLYFLL